MTDKNNPIIRAFNEQSSNVDVQFKCSDRRWPDPTSEMLDDPMFNAIWNCIKTWDINVPEVYDGYCGATGNHARAILDALTRVEGK